MSKRIALSLRGESFRTGSQNTRVNGEFSSVSEQLEACRSHIRWIDYLQSLGYTVDLYLNTYSTQYDSLLVETYGKYAHKATFYTNMPGKHQHIVQTLEGIDQTTYDFIISMRIDLYLKDHFFSTVILDDKVRFISITWYMSRKSTHGKERINDVYFQFPKEKFNYFNNAQSFINGYAYDHDFLDCVPMLKEDFGFFTNKYYDSDSEKDFNPFYRIVNRPESSIHHSGELRYPEDF